MCAALLPYFISHISSTNKSKIFCNTHAIALCITIYAGQWMCACQMYISFCVQYFYIITEYWIHRTKQTIKLLYVLNVWPGSQFLVLLDFRFYGTWISSRIKVMAGVLILCVYIRIYTTRKHSLTDCWFICILHSSFSLFVAWIAFLAWISVRKKYKNLNYFSTDARVVRKNIFSDF